MKLLFLDLFPSYIPFLVQCTKGTGDVIDPTVDSLIIYEEGGVNAVFDSAQITGSPFDPVQVNSKTGLWGMLIDKTAFTSGKFYIALWEMTVDGITTAKTEVFFASNASQFMADISGLPTLADIEASTVIAKEATLTTIVNRMGAFTGSGLNTVLGFLRAMARKTAGLTPSDMAGTYDNTTDSLEAISDTAVSPIPYVIGIDAQISNIDEFTESVELDEKTACAPVFVVTKNGNAVDLAGKTVYFTIKKKITDKLANKLLEKTGTVSDTNKATFSLTATDMTITPGNEYIGELSIWEGATCSDRRRMNVIVNKVVKESLA